MTCMLTCACRCGQITCGCHEDSKPRPVPITGPSCGVCGETKQTFGTSVNLCPNCDFARCPNKDECGKTVQQLSWVVCPHCGHRPE